MLIDVVVVDEQRANVQKLMLRRKEVLGRGVRI